ncbi:hypothetical protein Ndes2526A_g01884 [Nannochloris sp. 'desiccata']
MPNNKTEAELALQRKYELLRKKKEKEQKAKAAASGSKLRDQDDSTKEKIDPVRQAAIEALKRKRAANGGAATTSAPTAPAVVAAETAPKAEPGKPDNPPSQIKLKFVIPKKNLPNGGASNKPAAVPQPSKKPITVAATAPKPKPNASAAADSQPSAKRPAIRRTVPQPTVAQHDASQQEVGQPLLHHGKTPRPPPGAAAVPSIPRLFVGDLPEHFTSETLFNFFSEFHHVEEAHVVSSFCYGFVTFGSYEDAQAVLDFQSQQPIQVEDRHLRISWARDTPNDTVRPREYGYTANGIEGGDGGAQHEHPRIKAARLAAAQVLEQQDQHALEEVHYSEAPGRDLVCYDDL